MLLIILNLMPFLKQHRQTDFSAFEKDIAEFLEQPESKQQEQLVTITKPAVNYFSFDPNTLEEEGWIKLGLNKRLLRTLLNYRSKGGKFYKKEDLKKIYGFPDALYEELAPYVVINNSAPKKRIDKKPTKRKVAIQPSTNTESISKELKIFINSADTSELKKLKGIGSSYANRIVKYRNLLGGFYSIYQLKEVYGIDENRFQLFEKDVVVDSIDSKRLDINNTSL